MSLDAFKNFAKVTVSIGYDAAATSIVLNGGDGAKLPAVSFNATWWNSTDYADPTDDPNVEIVRVTACATDTLTVTRAQEGTSASTKNTGGKTYKMVAAVSALTMNKALDKTGDTMTGELTLAAGATGAASANIPAGVAPTSPVDGDVWYDGKTVRHRVKNAISVGGVYTIYAKAPNTAHTGDVVDTVMDSISIPAGLLEAGDTVNIYAWFTASGTVSTKVGYVKFGATALTSSTLVDATATRYICTASMLIVDGTHQSSLGALYDNITANIKAGTYALPGETISGAITLAFRAQLGNAGDTITFQGARVTIHKNA